MKVVALMSGGLDSSTTAARLAIEGHRVYPLFVNYGQRAAAMEKEAAKKYLLKSAERISTLGGLAEAEIRMPFLKSSLVGSTEITRTSDEAFSSPESKRIDWAPARNIIFLSVASAYCETVGARAISIGAYKEDEMPPYPDSSREFFDSMQAALSRGMYGDGFEIVTPFIGSYKWDIVEYSKENSLPVGLTWSCYDNLDLHCGACRNCVDRKKAFSNARVEDPTPYAL